MRFLVDANLPPAPARWLREQGHEADHIAQIGQPTETDDAIWPTYFMRSPPYACVVSR